MDQQQSPLMLQKLDRERKHWKRCTYAAKRLIDALNNQDEDRNHLFQLANVKNMTMGTTGGNGTNYWLPYWQVPDNLVHYFDQIKSCQNIPNFEVTKETSYNRITIKPVPKSSLYKPTDANGAISITYLSKQ